MNQLFLATPYSWQKKLWRQFLEQLIQQKLPHAILLTGGQGLGKSNFAEAWAGRLLCGDPKLGEFSGACGQCKSCLLQRVGNHPDLMRLEPHETGHPIKIDQVRGAGDWLVQTPQLGGYKVILLQLAENLNLNAANALLKNLEEPVKNTLFILVSNQPGRIVATVRSRCHHIAMPVPGFKEAHDWLSGLLQDQDKAELLLHISGGAPLRAQQLAEDTIFSHRLKIVEGLIDLCDANTSYVEVADHWQMLNPVITLDWMRLWIADLIKVVMTGSGATVRNRDMLDELEKISEKVVLNKLYLLDDRVLELRGAFLSGYNPNKILLLEEVLLRWQQCVSY